jgi:3-phenylpropionate/cinnamic acid dioxygenase small subunit
VTSTSTQTARNRCTFGSPEYCEIADFLIAEAWMLDDGRVTDWLDILADDIEYFMPTRSTVNRDDGLGFDDAMGHFDETKQSLTLRVRRVAESASAWTETPPSRTRRIISNIEVDRGEEADTYRVRSACLLLRNRLDRPNYDILSCGRDDLLRRADDSFVIVQRRVLIDQATLGTANLSMFF